MKEYFIVGNTFGAPFVSDTINMFVKASSPEKAVNIFIEKSTHPSGMYAINCYDNAHAFHKDESPVARWQCNQLIEENKATKGKGAWSYVGKGNGSFEIDSVLHTVKDYKEGKFV